MALPMDLAFLIHRFSASTRSLLSAKLLMHLISSACWSHAVDWKATLNGREVGSERYADSPVAAVPFRIMTKLDVPTISGQIFPWAFPVVRNSGVRTSARWSMDIASEMKYGGRFE